MENIVEFFVKNFVEIFVDFFVEKKSEIKTTGSVSKFINFSKGYFIFSKYFLHFPTSILRKNIKVP
jgi:hypothetical protein